MSAQKVLGLIALLFILGLVVFVQTRTPKEGYERTSTLRHQPLASKDLSSPGKLTKGQSSFIVEETRPILPQSSVPEDLSSPGEQVREQSSITVKNGRLSVWIQDRPLVEVLEEVSQRAIVPIIIGGGGGDQQVSIQFQDLPLDEGLRFILKDQDAFFFYGVEGNAPASLRVVWVYPKGRGNGLTPTPPETWASTVELEGRLADPDPEARARAAESLVERKGGEALDVVLQALKDRDDQVRNRVLYKALNSGVKLPSDFLYQLVLTDPLPEVRFLAIAALAEDPTMGADDLDNAKALAEKVMTTDLSPEVRNQAQQIFEQLSAQTTR